MIRGPDLVGTDSRYVVEPFVAYDTGPDNMGAVRMQVALFTGRGPASVVARTSAMSMRPARNVQI